MSTESVSQIQSWFRTWQGATAEQVSRVVDLWSQAPSLGSTGGASKFVRESMDQWTDLSKKNLEVGQAMFGEWLKLTRASLGAASELSQIQLDALKRTSEALGNKG